MEVFLPALFNTQEALSYFSAASLSFFASLLQVILSQSNNLLPNTLERWGVWRNSVFVTLLSFLTTLLWYYKPHHLIVCPRDAYWPKPHGNGNEMLGFPSNYVQCVILLPRFELNPTAHVYNCKLQTHGYISTILAHAYTVHISEWMSYLTTYSTTSTFEGIAKCS